MLQQQQKHDFDHFKTALVLDSIPNEDSQQQTSEAETAGKLLSTTLSRTGVRSRNRGGGMKRFWIQPARWDSIPIESTMVRRRGH